MNINIIFLKLNNYITNLNKYITKYFLYIHWIFFWKKKGIKIFFYILYLYKNVIDIYLIFYYKYYLRQVYFTYLHNFYIFIIYFHEFECIFINFFCMDIYVMIFAWYISILFIQYIHKNIEMNGRFCRASWFHAFVSIPSVIFS